MAGDGNCQFRVLSDQLFGEDTRHEYIRRRVVERLRQFPEEYEPYVPGNYQDYVDGMAVDGSWGDHITLQVRFTTVFAFVIIHLGMLCSIQACYAA